MSIQVDMQSACLSAAVKIWPSVLSHLASNSPFGLKVVIDCTPCMIKSRLAHVGLNTLALAHIVAVVCGRRSM